MLVLRHRDSAYIAYGRSAHFITRELRSIRRGLGLLGWVVSVAVGSMLPAPSVAHAQTAGAPAPSQPEAPPPGAPEEEALPTLSGRWRAEPLVTRWVIGEWSDACGPKPSGGGDRGGVVEIEQAGDELVVRGLGRDYRTTDCWEMHPALVRASHSGGPRAWSTVCASTDPARQELLRTTITATDDVVSFQETGQYQLRVEGQVCSASSGRWRTYRLLERRGASVTPPLDPGSRELFEPDDAVPAAAPRAEPSAPPGAPPTTPPSTATPSEPAPSEAPRAATPPAAAATPPVPAASAPAPTATAPPAPAATAPGAPPATTPQSASAVADARPAPAPAAAERCRQPGRPAQIELRPALKLLRAGETFAFRARVLDARGCRSAVPITWQLEGTPGVAVLERGRLSVAADAPEAELVVVARAAEQSVKAEVQVVSAERYASLLDSGEFDADGALEAASVAIIGGHSLGAPRAESEGTPPGRKWAFVGVVGSTALVLAALGGIVLSLANRRRKPPTVVDRERPSAAASPPAPRPPPTPAPAAVCPVCGRFYSDPDASTCADDGAVLVPVNAPSPP